MSCKPGRRMIVLLAAALCVSATMTHAQVPTPSLETFLNGAQRLLGELPSGEAAETVPSPAGQPSFHMPLTGPESGPVEVTATDGLISLSVRDASLRDVLSALAETQGLNLVIAAAADTLVTAEFKRQPLGEVLGTLLASTGHTWTQRDGVIVVTNIAAGGVLAPDVQGRRVAVIELDFASAADLQPAIEGLLSAVGQSYFVETNPVDNRRTKELLIVEDLEPYVSRIERYAAEADQPPRQVLIEVNILQVLLQDEQRCGVDFEALGRLSGSTLSVTSSAFAGRPVAAGAFATTASAAPSFFITSSGGDLSSVLDALISTTDSKTLASPRMLALNGQTSRMQIGEEIGYLTNLSTQGGGVNQQQANFLSTGVILEVTPRITRDGRVLLQILPEVSTGAINEVTQAPDKQTTQLQTNALLSSGQGMIIGGMIQELDDTRINRIPVLGSLPYVNALFQSRKTDKRRIETVVALVPHVLPYSPVEQCRNDQEFARAREPLLYGPLCRFPRPYEARLADPRMDLPHFRCLDRRDPYCCPPGTEVPCGPGIAATSPRRLPPTTGDERVATAASAEQPLRR